MDKIAVGINVSRDQLDVAIYPSGEVFVVASNKDGFKQLCNRLDKVRPEIVALEATGGYEAAPAAAIATAGFVVAIVNPVQVRAFAKALGKRAKSDPIDAGVIAHFAAATDVKPRLASDEATQRLADLVSRRRQIIEMLGAEQNRLQRASTGTKKSINRLIKALKRELEAVEVEIHDAVRGSPLWAAKEDLMSSVPGIGPAISRTLIAEMPELGQLDRKQIAALAGLAPYTRQSGQWKGRSFIGGGRASVRAGLFMGAVVAKRYNAVLLAFFVRLVDAGKPKMVAVIAVARTLLTILNAMVRDGIPWKGTVSAAS